jgi:anti-sigma factor RsiW
VADVAARHADHDAELVAALLDDDTAPAERAEAEALIATCAGCAALHADLVSLAGATRALPIPSRPRDFRLTAAHAARLGAPITREPVAPTPRLTREMTATHTASAHASHDTMLVASLADHSLAAPEREAAEALVATCGLCAALHTDLVALRTATRAMPTPTRPRDYTLTPADATRLHPTGFRRWIVAFGTSRDAISRPLAVGLTTLGLAGLLVATIPSAIPMGSATSGAPAFDATQGGAGAAAPEFASGAPDAGAIGGPAVPSGDAVGVAGSPQPVPVGTGRNGLEVEPNAATAAPVQGVTGGSTKATDSASGRTNDGVTTGSDNLFSLGDRTGPSAMMLVSGALLIAGLGLFLMRWASRRFGA